MTAWTAPYHGVQHTPAMNGIIRSHWCSVDDHGTCATLVMWYPGGQFGPRYETYPTVAAAREAGERWLESQSRT